MAHFARVSREMLYAAQPPLQLEENARELQQNMAQPNGPATEQPTWQQEQMSKKFAKKSKWQKLDIHADTIADNTRGTDPPARLAPPLLHQVAPSTPAPSESTHNTPSPNTKNSQHHKGPRRDHRNKNKMASRCVPPHLRKKQTNGNPPHADTADLARKTRGLKLEGADPAEAQSTQTQLSTAARPKAPPSPPSTPAEQQAQNNAGWGCYEPKNAGWGNDDPKPELLTPGNNRRKRHIWPKNRDMKPISDDEDEGGVEFLSDSNGDPDYDVKKLVDWNGDWIAPPETWSARHAFTDRHFGAGIEKWINGHDASCTVNLTDLLKLPEFAGVGVEGGVVLIDGEEVAQQTINHEIAPRSWVATKIEGDAPQVFWQAFADRAPSPISDIDITEHRPFWEEYLDGTTDFLNPMQHPAKSVLDMNDEENSKQGPGKSATQHLRDIFERNQARKRRHQTKKFKQPQIQELPPRHPGYRPTSNVYLRPVVAADAKGIQELYNHYVANTIHALEYKPRAIQDIVGRIRNITNEGLPYIVAVHKGSHPRGPQDFVNERIVGIAYIEDFVDKGSMCRFTFELECYVHPDFVRQNIAKCLFDRLLEMVNTGYLVKGGYSWVNQGEYLKTGLSRVVKVINCHVYHEEGDDVVWVTEFMRKFKFRKAGHFFKMGYKFGKVVDATIYQHETSEIINADAPPMEPL
ncbi:hypothetical protein P171DRAFT_486674 [Karstenula rhodostoma CBS 690.94]|uniref:N-acetyltransferase domain-containing protein n=1 Tax=Karstenula rhodostoma CBS 690.94 TaxID=1392251 RepID=A0A9P4PCV5_9PLEO|nr:hypothetical protein P171DRAFT_486674 [Karstenula rhodostoma CBS 690.94]